MLTHCAVALTHVLAMAAPATINPVAAPDVTSSTSPSEAERSEAAKKFYAEQRYLESAHAYEILYAEFKAPKYLFNAAAAREAAGHDAHAYVLFRRYLETPGLSADDHERGEARMAPLRRRTTAVQLQFSPSPRPANLTVTMTRRGVEPLELDEQTLQALDRSSVVEIWAETGEWSVRAQASGFRAAESAVQATPGATRALTLELAAEETAGAVQPEASGSLTIHIAARRLPGGLRLQLRRNGEVREEPITAADSSWLLPVGAWSVSVGNRNFNAGPAPVRIARNIDQPLALVMRRTTDSKLTLGLAIGAGVLAASGIMGIAVSETVGGDGWKVPSDAGNTGKFLTRARFSGASAGLLGAGLGLGVGAVGMALESRMRQPRAFWGAVAGVGGAATLAGLLLTGFAGGRLGAAWTRTLVQDEDMHVQDEDMHKFRASTTLLGLGTGLLLSGVIQLVRSLQRRPNTARG